MTIFPTMSRKWAAPTAVRPRRVGGAGLASLVEAEHRLRPLNSYEKGLELALGTSID